MQPSVPAVAAVAILASSLALFLLRPRGLPEFVPALGGGLLMVALGLLPVRNALAQLAGAWNVFLFFLGLAVSATVAERAGLFRSAASLATRLACGSQRRLLIALFVAGVAITSVLSNDATALLLTPVAFAAASRLGLAARPYVFTCALVANAASFVLPVSNPANLLVLAGAPVSLGTFLRYLLLPSILALAVTLGGLLVVFRRELAEPFTAPSDVGGSPDRRVRLNLLAVGGLTLAYVVGSALAWPLGVVAVGGAALLVALDVVAVGRTGLGWFTAVPWSLFPLFAGLLLLVGGAERAGALAPAVYGIDALQTLGAAGPVLAALGLGAAANVLNNLPAALVASTALGNLPSGPPRTDLVAGALIGVDLGPNLTPVGALSNLLWLLLLRRRGLEIATTSYLRIAVVVTLPALVAAVAGLWIVGRV